MYVYTQFLVLRQEVLSQMSVCRACPGCFTSICHDMHRAHVEVQEPALLQSRAKQKRDLESTELIVSSLSAGACNLRKSPKAWVHTR